MIKRVEEAYRKAKIAEDTFDLASEFINMKASSSIDIFSDRAVSRVVHILLRSIQKKHIFLFLYQMREKKIADENERGSLLVLFSLKGI
ncbi:MAG: hypothetical protein IKI62_05060 [Clostridia bacterium]|nr:hypothetical protein [Clostridia bacterium]